MRAAITINAARITDGNRPMDNEAFSNREIEEIVVLTRLSLYNQTISVHCRHCHVLPEYSPVTALHTGAPEITRKAKPSQKTGGGLPLQICQGKCPQPPSPLPGYTILIKLAPK